MLGPELDRLCCSKVVANRSLLTLLSPLDAKLHARLALEREKLGYNVAALGIIKQAVEVTSDRAFFEDVASARKARGKPSVAELRRQTQAREHSNVKRPRKKK